MKSYKIETNKTRKEKTDIIPTGAPLKTKEIPVLNSIEEEEEVSRHLQKERFFIAIKANRVLQSVFIALVIILIRVWHLCVIQHDALTEEAHKPRKRSLVTTPPRATIRDRFNEPLAYNVISYNLALVYAHIQEIPSIGWKKDSIGNQIKYFKRKEYIHALAEFIGEELSIDSERLEDEIHSMAVFFGSRPYVIKKNLSEEQFYRFKFLEKEWIGLQAQMTPERHYPLGRIGSHLIGYVGAIDLDEHIQISQEILKLKQFIKLSQEGESEELPPGVANTKEARARVAELEQRAYKIHDHIGKTGIEYQFEEELRGYKGIQAYLTNAKGNIVRELPESRKAIPGERILLTISAELQTFAEELLIQNEKVRDKRIERNENHVIDQPWIKGGAICVMEPKSGELLALASYPRFDPNDFTKQSTQKSTWQRLLWLENESYLSAVWDGQCDLFRESAQTDERLTLNWKQYLDFIAPENSALRRIIQSIRTIGDVIKIQRALKPFERSKEASKEKSQPIPNLIHHLYHDESLSNEELALKEILNPYLKDIKHNQDRLLGLDIARLVANEEHFSERLLQKVKNLSLDTFRTHSMAFVTLEDFVKSEAQKIFHHIDFKKWKEEQQISFLKEKRKKEVELAIYAKPYLDYLDQEEKEQFQVFWEEHGWSFILTFLKGSRGDISVQIHQKHFQEWHSEIANGAHGNTEWKKAYDILQMSLTELDTPTAREYLQSLRRFNHLNRPLWGSYRQLRGNKGEQLEKHLAMGFYPKFGFGYSKAWAFRQATSQGSIFKLITAYAILKQRYEDIIGAKLNFSLLNPLTINEKTLVNGKTVYLAKLDDGTLIPQRYKKGRLCSSVRKNIGEIDLIGAIESSSNPYFSLLAGDHLHHPNDLVQAAMHFGYGSKTGIMLPGECKGNLPNDLETNPTGLYSFAIGQHTLVSTPLQTTVMLSAIGNGGTLVVPKIVNLTIGSYPEYTGFKNSHQTFPFEQSLQSVGIGFPLFLATAKASSQPILNRYPSLKKENIDLPHPIRNTILEGMRQVVDEGQTGGMWSLRHYFEKHPEAINSLTRLRHQMVGKTGTAEGVEVLNLDHETGTRKCCQIWFGGISFKHDLTPQERIKLCVAEDLFGEPELVVVVYLRHGGYGKDAEPLAAQVVEKWREIQAKHTKKE